MIFILIFPNVLGAIKLTFYNPIIRSDVEKRFTSMSGISVSTQNMSSYLDITHILSTYIWKCFRCYMISKISVSVHEVLPSCQNPCFCVLQFYDKHHLCSWKYMYNMYSDSSCPLNYTRSCYCSKQQ